MAARRSCAAGVVLRLAARLADVKGRAGGLSDDRRVAGSLS